MKKFPEGSYNIYKGIKVLKDGICVQCYGTGKSKNITDNTKICIFCKGTGKHIKE